MKEKVREFFEAILAGDSRRARALLVLMDGDTFGVALGAAHLARQAAVDERAARLDPTNAADPARLEVPPNAD